MISNSLLLVFALAFMGCVLTTPMMTRVASWLGAIDRPDQFRRIHKGATPRLGGLGLAFGLAISLLPIVLGGYFKVWEGREDWFSKQWSVIVAAIVILLVGVVDDTRGMRPRIKLMGQTAAVLILIAGGIQITKVSLFGILLNFSYQIPISFWGYTFIVDPPSTLVTLIWFLGCMNIWNLIDGMDGLASGVGLLVSGTLMLVALHQQNWGSALMSAALAGALAGFLLYNWHPAVIFLGDSGSMLIGLLLGVIGVQDSLKGTVGVSILFPILAMGLPISDTAMAIFRRWVRNLPMSTADRRHVHHLLIGLGLNPRQAAVYLYCFSGFLCGTVLLGVALQNDFLALVVGLSGCVAFLLILTSRRDELNCLLSDLRARLSRGKQERFASKTTWDAIQRIELGLDKGRIWEILLEASHTLGCDAMSMTCHRQGRTVFENVNDPAGAFDPEGAVSGPTASFRLSSGDDLLLSVSLHQDPNSTLATDITFRFLQRLSLATAERLERLLDSVEAIDHDMARPTVVVRGASEPARPRETEKEPVGVGIDAEPEPFRGTTILTIDRGSQEVRAPVRWFRRALGLNA